MFNLRTLRFKHYEPVTLGIVLLSMSMVPYSQHCTEQICNNFPSPPLKFQMLPRHDIQAVKVYYMLAQYPIRLFRSSYTSSSHTCLKCRIFNPSFSVLKHVPIRNRSRNILWNLVKSFPQFGKFWHKHTKINHMVLVFDLLRTSNPYCITWLYGNAP